MRSRKLVPNPVSHIAFRTPIVSRGGLGGRLTGAIWWILPFAATGLLGVASGVSLTHEPRLSKLLFAAPLLLLAFAVQPEKLFVGWLLLAPLVQGAANGSAQGHLLFKYFFLGPPLIMVVRMATGSFRSRGFWLVDAFPALYLLDILVSARLFPSAYTSPAQSTTRAIYIAVGACVVVYYFVAFAPASRRFPELVAAAFIWTGVVVAALAIVDGLTGWNVWHHLINGGGTRRAVSTFSGPEELGTYIGASTAFALGVLLFRGPKSLRLPSLLVLGLSAPALFFSYTRGPMLATAVVAVVIALLATRARWPAVLVLAAAGVILYASWGAITSSAIYKNRLAVNTATPRVVLTDAALDLFRRHPLTGVGYATFDQAKLTLPVPPADTYIVQTTTSHNTFLTVLAESGALGLALLVLPWFVIGWRAVMDSRRGLVQPWIVAGCLGTVGAYAIGAATYDARFFPLVFGLPWITLGLARKVVGGHTTLAESG